MAGMQDIADIRSFESLMNSGSPIYSVSNYIHQQVWPPVGDVTKTSVYEGIFRIQKCCEDAAFWLKQKGNEWHKHIPEYIPRIKDEVAEIERLYKQAVSSVNRAVPATGAPGKGLNPVMIR